MPQGLSRGYSTYTSDRVLQILHDDLHKPIPGAPGTPSEFGVSKAGVISKEDGWMIFHTQEDRRQQVSSWCQESLTLIQSPTDHIEKLNKKHNEILECNFQPPEPHDTIVERVVQLLSRLPATPPEISNQANELCSTISDEYFIPGHPRKWNTLPVTNFVNTNTIRLALQMEMAGQYYWGNMFRAFVDTLSEMLEAALNLGAGIQHEPTELFILQAFLWTSWQRAIMLQFSYLLGGQIRLGYDYGRNRGLFLEGTGALQMTVRNF